MIEGLAKRLKSARANANYTRKQASELIGVSESLIGLYESGARQPSLDTLVKLAAWYKTSPDYLLGCESNERNMVLLDGLTEKQAQAVRNIVSAFRE